jgi:Formate hydrogenlyase subunit 6/NADH:ubiquinone oxidoreductase 23 kD subunit (chain I)
MTLATATRPVAALRWGPLVIASEHCKGCELCVSVCPPGVLALDLDTVNGLGHHPVQLVDATRCTSCALCAKVCPDAVFTVFARPRETGW